MSDNLPPLPGPFANLRPDLNAAVLERLGPIWGPELYHSWMCQMRAYGDTRAAAEREACARIAATPFVGEQDDITMAAKDRVAAAIRARGET